MAGTDPSVERTRDFFAARAAGWEDRFPDDDPAYRAAVGELGPPPAATALDVGCGTGRALPALRAAVGGAGLVMGIDITPEMLQEAARRGRDRHAALVLADARRLPLPDGVAGAIFAAGLLPHVDPVGALAELARVTAAGGGLALFHPIGRRALAARHGREPDPGDIRVRANLEPALLAAGWDLVSLDDGEERYLALARRLPGRSRP